MADKTQADTLTVTSPAFGPGGAIPLLHTGYGADESPPLHLSGLSPQAVSLAVVLVDLDIPLIREYPHWLLWNLPPQEDIPGALPKGEALPSLGGARQGLAYGKHEYRGPKPPRFIRTPHRYVFTVYVLDALLELDPGANKKQLLAAMRGHVLQQGSITGTYKNT